MIEITCSKPQKKHLIDAIAASGECIFPQRKALCGFDPDSDCKKCLEKKIKWHTGKDGAKK